MNTANTGWSRFLATWEGICFGIIVGFLACNYLIESGRMSPGTLRFFFLTFGGLCTFAGVLPRVLTSIATGIRRYRAVARTGSLEAQNGGLRK